MKMKREAGNRSKGLVVLSGCLLAGSLAGCGAAWYAGRGAAGPYAQEAPSVRLAAGAYSGYEEDISKPSMAAVFEDEAGGAAIGQGAQTEEGAVIGQGAQAEEGTVIDQGAQAEESTGGGAVAYAAEYTDDVSDRKLLEEQLSVYEPFGMTYDAKTNVLKYNGKRVRYFEDYYPVGEDGEEMYGGIDFFDEKGVVDVCAIRDFDGIVRNADGSFDPSGRVVGLRRCTDAEFAARDIEAIKNPPTTEAICGEPLSQKEMEAIAAEYRPFGVTYDAKKDVWYFKGEKVRCFLDVLMSNGADLNGGDFQGTMRRYWQDGGTVDISTVRDFSVKNADGYGTLTGVKRQ